jgi:hypothetical protein
LVLSWWVGGVAWYADGHRVGSELVGAGTPIALAVGFVAYVVRLRRS